MSKPKKFSLFPAYCDKAIIISTLCLVIFGSFMIMSAEMGELAGETSVIARSAFRQIVFFLIGLIAMIICSRIRLINLKMSAIWTGYYVLIGLLLSTRLFGSINGAYAWIRFGQFTIQPSEFAKVYIMILGGKLLGPNNPQKNKENFLKFLTASCVYAGIIFGYQHDLGSAVVLAGIAFVIMLVPPYKELNNYHFRMIIFMIVVFAVLGFLLTPLGSKFLEQFSSYYQVGRFLASYNPFNYQYDSGYHVIMGLVSFATGGLFGLGYGQSIHKYMNFPNPSTDFILPVIVEETGIIGFLVILVGYGFILIPLIKYALAVNYVSSKMILLGTFTYLAIHFVLNVGGVSGLVPLTGVPLLLISSGGSSLIATMCALGLSECEIANYRKVLKE